MMVMVANQTNVEFCALAGRYPGSLGHLYGPGAQRTPTEYFPYALDNGAYPAWEKNIEWNRTAWMDLLAWAEVQAIRPLWAVVPDVVTNRERTLEQWPLFAPLVRACGIRPAFAVQDDMTFEDVPDDECMIFLGGSTGWKTQAIQPWCQRFPGRVHVARVNEQARLALSYGSGAVSVDGTGWWHKTTTAWHGESQLACLKKFVTETGTPFGANWKRPAWRAA